MRTCEKCQAEIGDGDGYFVCMPPLGIAMVCQSCCAEIGTPQAVEQIVATAYASALLSSREMKERR